MYVEFLLFLNFYYSSGYYFNNPSEWLRQKGELNLNQTFFPTLKGYQVNAKETTELVHPWVASVIHSQKNKVPYMCTATCIEERIFITAARCVHLLKVKYTSLIYQNERLKAKAFVLPSKGTKQMFDDIGFIIVYEGFKGKWEWKAIYGFNRTDNEFKWLSEKQYKPFDHRVVGYTQKKAVNVFPPWNSHYHLTQLDVVFDMALCREIMTENKKIPGFNVPCYHSCTLEMLKQTDPPEPLCQNYHGVLGGLIYNIELNTILGVATWGAYFRNFELPVGFAVPNSENYFTDLVCARKIEKDKTSPVDAGYYQKMCDIP